MVRDGLMMSGLMTPGLMLGHRKSASASYPLLEKVMRLRWLAMSCTFSAAEPRKEKI